MQRNALDPSHQPIFFHFGISPPIIGNGHLVNSQIASCSPSPQSSVSNPKPVLPQFGQCSRTDLAPEHLVARFSMSVRFKLVAMLESIVSPLLPRECQKYKTRCASEPAKREPNTTSARPSRMGHAHGGVVSRDRIPESASCTITNSEPSPWQSRAQSRALALVDGVTEKFDQRFGDRASSWSEA